MRASRRIRCVATRNLPCKGRYPCLLGIRARSGSTLSRVFTTATGGCPELTQWITLSPFWSTTLVETSKGCVSQRNATASHAQHLHRAYHQAGIEFIIMESSSQVLLSDVNNGTVLHLEISLFSSFSPSDSPMPMLAELFYGINTYQRLHSHIIASDQLMYPRSKSLPCLQGLITGFLSRLRG